MKTHQGLSIIELIIVMAVIALVIPALFMMFLSTLQARAKLYALQETKRAGDYVFNAIQQTIRDRAISIHNSNNIWDDSREVCSTKSRFDTDTSSQTLPLFFKDKNNVRFHYFPEVHGGTTKIASYSSLVAGSIYLTNKHVIANINNMKCYRTSNFSSPIVEIEFMVNTTWQSGLRHEDYDYLKYTVKVKLRN